MRFPNDFGVLIGVALKIFASGDFVGSVRVAWPSRRVRVCSYADRITSDWSGGDVFRH
jgi:hypothetical protein